MKSIEEIIALHNLEELDIDLYRGYNPEVESFRIFGGQVVAQGLVSANRTVEGRTATSLKSDFLRTGDPKKPIIYEVDRIRDGKTFTTRRVVAKQKGRAIFSMAVTYQVDEAGFDHHLPMPLVPGPDAVPNPSILFDKLKDKLPPAMLIWYDPKQPIEQRPVIPVDPTARKAREAHHAVWLKTKEKLSDDPQMHQYLFAYASDMNLLDTCILPHGGSFRTDEPLQIASLDHCIWFHKPFRMDEWLLVSQDSPAAAGGRGFNRATVFNEQGDLVASLTQETLIRRVTVTP